MSEVDDLRSQLRNRGYLTHGIERWFALDPWSSRAFWLELATVALKAAVLIALFGALPMTAIMLFRNFPAGAIETTGLFLCYAAAWFVAAFAFVVLLALVLKIRPALPVDKPRALLVISLAAAALLVAVVGAWWYGFDTPPTVAEFVTGAALATLFFLAAAVVVSAALLSFSIYEVRRVPLIHQKRRGGPMAIAAIVLIALLFVPAYGQREPAMQQPMVVTRPSSAHVALVAVDGLTYDILQSRPDISGVLNAAVPVATISGASATERWASLGTGVPTSAHGVRAIEGVRFLGGTHLLQRVSRGDVVLMRAAPALRIARREPLPPTVRRREYVWEILAERGIPSLAVNWWATADEVSGGLRSVGPEVVFANAKGDPLRVDSLATQEFFTWLDHMQPRFATVYLPALDVILNRLDLDRGAQLSQSLRALNGIASVVNGARARGYTVVLVGLPGEGQRGSAVVALRHSLGMPKSAWDIVPTVLDLYGFPASAEMRGRSLVYGSHEPRIATYGRRATGQAAPAVNKEYYENLRSLGYIR